jgi:hypothetical protein
VANHEGVLFEGNLILIFLNIKLNVLLVPDCIFLD